MSVHRHQCPLGSVASDLCHFMLMCDVPMTRNQTGRTANGDDSCSLDNGAADVHVGGDAASRDGACMTDGSGFIGSAAARELWSHLTKAEPSTYNPRKEVPSLFQVRCFTQHGGFKGTLVVRNDIDPNAIQLRESMRKMPPSSRFASSSSSSSSSTSTSTSTSMRSTSSRSRCPAGQLPTDAKPSIDVVGVSNTPRPAHLNRQLALVLSAVGVDPAYTVGLASQAVANALNILVDAQHGYQYLREDAQNHDSMEHFCWTMIAAGHSVSEPYLHRRLEVIAKQRIRRWKAKLQIPFPNAAFMYVMKPFSTTGI